MPFAGKTITDFQTLFVNTSGGTRVFPFLPPHGKSLASNGTATFDYDIRTRMNDRDITALNTARDAGYCSYFIRQRVLLPYTATTASVVAVGDYLYLDSGEVKPAAEFTWDTDLATTQANFAKVFVGIAVTAKAADTAGTVYVDVSPDSPYVLTCTSESHTFGDTLAPKKDSGNTLVSNQAVKAVAASSCFKAIRKDTSSTTAIVTLQSSVYGGDTEKAAVVAALTDNSGGAAADGTIAVVTAPTAIGATLTDSTGLSGTHDDTLAAVTTLTPSVAWDGATVFPSAADATAIATAITTLNQNASDTAQKVIELVTAQGEDRTAIVALTDAVKELSTKVNAILTSLKDAGAMAS